MEKINSKVNLTGEFIQNTLTHPITREELAEYFKIVKLAKFEEENKKDDKVEGETDKEAKNDSETPENKESEKEVEAEKEEKE